MDLEGNSYKIPLIKPWMEYMHSAISMRNKQGLQKLKLSNSSPNQMWMEDCTYTHFCIQTC